MQDVNDATLWDLGSVQKIWQSFTYWYTATDLRVGRSSLLNYLNQRFLNSFKVIFTQCVTYDSSRYTSAQAVEIDEWHKDGWYFDPKDRLRHNTTLAVKPSNDFWLFMWSNQEPTELQDPNDPDTVYTTSPYHVYLLQNQLWNHRRVGLDEGRQFVRAYIVETGVVPRS